jgi:hypothetical protein
MQWLWPIAGADENKIIVPGTYCDPATQVALLGRITPSGSWSGGFSLSIPKGAKNPEAAWEFIKCATSSEPFSTATLIRLARGLAT